MRSPLGGLDRRRLRLWLLLLFTALALPTALLIGHAYSQLKWEAFHHYQQQAETLAQRIDEQLGKLVQAEEARRFTDYAFLNVTGPDNRIERSPLSAYPVARHLPGLLGYFQVDSRGLLTTPLLPAERGQQYAIAPDEFTARQALQAQITRILSENRLVTATPHEGERPGRPPSPVAADELAHRDTAAAGLAGGAAETEADRAQAAFDLLSRERKLEKRKAPSRLGRVEELQLDTPYQQAPLAQKALEAAAPQLQRSVRREQNILPEPSEAIAAVPQPRITTFESEIDPFEISLLDSGHFVLFRKVWRDGERYIQGALIERDALLHEVVEPLFRDMPLAEMSNLAVAYQGEIFGAIAGDGGRRYLSSAEELNGALLYRSRLSAPLSGIELLVTITHLPAGPGGAVVGWLAALLTLLLCGGFLLIYRLGLQQIALTRQQQDFVSAVSHELKTPLTSIRMYGEMLREGWVDEARRGGYYDYITGESERLSRLIDNVLQLARLTRNGLQLAPQPMAVGELLKGVHAKIASQIERAGFELQFDYDQDAASHRVEVDSDAFTQVVINLVDNAIKFSAKAACKRIEIVCHRQQQRLLITLRDHGPGIPRDQLRKIFTLFYRSENELTRETVGTGIGLALVNQLVQAMGGSVDVINREPGAEFRLLLPLVA